MPIYCFKCLCGACKEELLSVKDCNKRVECDCGKKMYRDFISEHATTTNKEYFTPILSDALGVNAKQLNEARRLHPDREYLPDGRLVIRSHAQRNRYLKEDGFHDRDGFN